MLALKPSCVGFGAGASFTYLTIYTRILPLGSTVLQFYFEK